MNHSTLPYRALLFAWLFAASCTSPLPPLERPAEGAHLLYEAPQPVFALQGAKASCSAYLQAHPGSGQCLLTVRLRHEGSGPLPVPYQQWQLATPDGLRSSVEYTDAYPDTLQPGQTADYRLLLRPTNSRQLRMLLDLPGDFPPQYVLQLGPWPDAPVLAAPAEAYQRYLAQWGVAGRLARYQAQAPEGWTEAQAALLQSVFPKAPEASISQHDAEWNVQGVVLRLYAYQLADTLCIGYRVANQSTEQLRGREEAFRLIGPDGEAIGPARIRYLLQPAPAPDGQGWAMRRGDRFQADFYYALPKAEGLRLMPGLEWLQAQKPLLAQPWALQPADLPPLP